MEALDVSVFPGTARFDVEGVNRPLFEPVLDGVSNKLWAIVATQVLRRPIPLNRRFNYPDRSGELSLYDLSPIG